MSTDTHTARKTKLYFLVHCFDYLNFIKEKIICIFSLWCFDTFTPSWLTGTKRQVVLMLCINPTGFRGEGKHVPGWTKRQLWICEWLRTRMPEEWQEYNPASQGPEGTAAEHKFWQVCSRPSVQQTAAVLRHHSSLQKFSSLEGKIHKQVHCPHLLQLWALHQ